jgi:hypothetical protein
LPVLVCCWGTAALAQSSALLEAIRLHRAGATETARSELQACVEVKCPDADALSLTLGFLELSDSQVGGLTSSGPAS